MIVDAHTHIFPKAIVERRESLSDTDALFGAIYRDRRARMATAGELLAAMERDAVDRAVVAGVTWAAAGEALEHNGALLSAAARSGGQLAPLCCIPIAAPMAVVREMERCAAAGAAGFGELRLDAYLAVDPALPDVIAEMALRLDLPLLLHASEPVGHDYAGKTGGGLAAIWKLLSDWPSLTVILAHLGGGLPFYSHMPEVRGRLRTAYVDTAAAPWLYEAAAVRETIARLGADRVLFGSDFPLRRSNRDIAWLGTAGLRPDEMEAVLGLNAVRVYRLAEG